MGTKIYWTKVQVNVPTPKAGRIFSREKLEAAISEYMASENHMGMLEEIGQEETFDLDYERISHNVKNVFIDEEDFLCVEVAFLETEQGKIASMTADMLEVSAAMIGFCGWEGDSNIVEEAALINFNLAWKVEEIQLAA